MVIMKNALLAAALLASAVVAAPVAGLNARALVIQTVTETDWTTVGYTATVWVNDADPTTAAEVTTTATPTEVTPTTAPAPVAPTPTPAAPAVSPAGFAAEQQYTTAAPSTFSTSTAAAAAASPSTTGILTQKDSAASTSGTCEGSGNSCVGDVTHYDGGLGACGWNVDSNSQMAVALPYGFMGTQSNGNPFCGRSVTLFNPNTGGTVQATVGDKCMGCVDRAIDLTNAAFAAIVPGGDGRVSGIQWWLN